MHLNSPANILQPITGKLNSVWLIPVICGMKNIFKNNFMKGPVVVSWNVEVKNQKIF